MSENVTLPPDLPLLADGSRLGGWWHTVDPDEGRVVCDLCPRACSLKPGDRGFCFVRENRDGRMVLSTYGRSTGFCIDPIEKKPLNHFFPGTSVLSFGTAGCNLGCKFCQNWDISKSRQVERLSENASPETIAAAAQRLGCRSVAYTYNDPIIWAEYAIDTARACRDLGVKNVAVTAGYISPEARAPFFHEMDAANVDLKAFTEEFYHKITYSHLAPVLDTLRWLRHETDVWIEITNLIIPQANDSPDELRAMCQWVLDSVGDDVPIHFTAFHPDFRMQDRPATPHETLLAAYEIARAAGMKYVYVGNVFDARHDSTYCPQCGQLLIERNWHELGEYHLHGDKCGRGASCEYCGEQIAGRFDDQPGSWGRRRQPVRIADFARSAPAAVSSGHQLNTIAGRAGEPKEEREAGLQPREKQEESTMIKTDATGTTAPAGFTAHQPPRLTDEQSQLVYDAAWRFVAAEVTGKPPALADVNLAGAAPLTVMGVFVTLKRSGRLRACCGSLGKPMPLIDALRASAQRTAVGDVRLPPVSRTELPYLELSVSLLHSFQPIKGVGRDRAAAIEIGTHGLQIARGDAAGLLLPIVAVENRLGPEEFLRQVCRKAGLPSNAWEDDTARIVTFEVRYLDGSFDPRIAEDFGVETAARFTEDEVRQLAEHCRENVSAYLRGATPNYYLPGVSDGHVPGAMVSIYLPEVAPTHFVRFSMRPGVPLQASLLSLSEAAAVALRSSGVDEGKLGTARIGATVLYDTAMHGTVADADLRGFDPRRRAALVTESNRSAWVYDPQQTVEQLVEQAAREARCNSPHAASVFSLAVQTTEPSLVLTTAPQPRAGGAVRPPAVAGAFYPADANELARLVDDCFADPDAESAASEDWPALMMPHAGLVYSGRIAAQTLQRVRIPETVIVIGPKHTRLGMEWAVTPHETWSLPGGDMACDAALARRLAAGIPGLELDGAAHQSEHAVEVELPLIRKLAPEARVVGVAIGGGDMARCRGFAQALAKILREETTMPLLVISSDMNHFATDAENRRLDELALAAMESLDAAQLLETVMGHQISMCGVLPAVIVLETLRKLGRLSRCERVAYGTSADVSGDKSRVVGYAGMLLG